MRTNTAALILGAGLAAELMTGCVPFGCGAPSDPANVAAFALTGAGSINAGQPISGLAFAPAGVWLVSTTAQGTRLSEVSSLGAAPVRSAFLAGTARGLAWDGAHVWVGLGATAGEYDPSTLALTAQVTLPVAAQDLAWDDGLVLAPGTNSFEVVDPQTAQLIEAVPVNKLDAVDGVAYHDGETWVVKVGSPILVYDATGTLMATAQADALADDGRTTEVHLAFDGETLVIARGSVAYRYSIDRTAPTAAL